MHVFCAACYSGWMERSPLCPTCRCPVERIRKNHILNNLVEAYLIQHPGRLPHSAFRPLNSQEERPFCSKNNRILWFLCVAEKCRSEEDLKSMDGRNKITQDMLQPKVERSFSDEEGSSDYLLEFSDNDSDSSDMRYSLRFGAFTPCSRHVSRNVLSFLLFVRSQPIMCRQCPGYKADVSQLLFATGSNYWFPGLPAPAPVPPPPKPAATEGCAKAAGEQPSTSSDGPSGDGEYLHLKSHRDQISLHINSSNMPFCSIPGRSSPRVSLPPSGHPPHLHLLPPADARQTGRARQPAGRPAM